MTVFENISKFKIRLFPDDVGIKDWSLVEIAIIKTLSMERMNKYRKLRLHYEVEKEISKRQKAGLIRRNIKKLKDTG